jgi:hypothetical protein
MKNNIPQTIKATKTVIFPTVFMGLYFAVVTVTIKPILADDSMGDELSLEIPLVHQLNDIYILDWEISALKQLIEKYGIRSTEIERIFRNNENFTRDEFAVILSITLDHIYQKLESNNFNSVTPQDLSTIKRLQTQFATELSILRGRVDGTQARVTEQELTQFSPTTQLRGMATFNLAGVTFSGDIKAEGIDSNQAIRDENNQPIQRITNQGNITTAQRIELGFNTSFNGDDLLLTKLVMANNNSALTQLRSTGNLATTCVPFCGDRETTNFNNLSIEELYYQFPLNDSLEIVIAPKINWYNYFDTLGNFPNNSPNLERNLLSPIEQGTGIISRWQINDQLQLQTAYLRENNSFLNTSSRVENRKNGLFEGTNGLTAQLTYSPVDDVNISLLYQRIFNIEIKEGQLFHLPVLGVADDGKGGNLKSANAHLIGVSFDWFINPEIRLFGRYNYANTQIIPMNNNLGDGEINSQQLQAGINILDLGKEGAVTTFSYTIPFSIIEGNKYLVSGSGNRATEQEFIASYYLPVNDYLAFIPAFYLIVNPNQFNTNRNIYMGNLQMQLLF